MMLTGKITKVEGPWWYARCELIGAHTQGRSLADAMRMLEDCIETLIDHKGVKVHVSELVQAGAEHVVQLAASEPARLAALVLAVQRERNRLSLADVAKKLGASSRNAYARYEQGVSLPSLDKFVELLEVVAPDLVLTIGPRKPAKPARAPRKVGKRSRSGAA